MDEALRYLAFGFLAIGVVVLLWWQDFDGMRSSWEYHRRCRKRERVSGERFYSRFYQDGELPKELVIRFRDFHAGYWGEDPELLRPEDDLFQVNAGADVAEWVKQVEAQFGVAIRWETRSSGYDMPDATFDSLLRFVNRERQALRS